MSVMLLDMTPEARARLSAHVRRRRQALGLTVTRAAAEAGINRMTWDSLERGTRHLRDDNHHKVEQALGWEQGSIDAILNGRDPIPAESDDDRRDWTDPETGEVYTDPDERAIWALSNLSQHTRRGLIVYLRADRGMRRAG